MNIQRQTGIISTINFYPFFATEEYIDLRSSMFSETRSISNITPKNQLDIYDESILVFEDYYQALNYLVNLVRIAARSNISSGTGTSLRLSLCCGDYFIHQDQIYGDAVNLATKLSYSSRENELLICGIDNQVIKNFINSQNDISYFVRDDDPGCMSLGLIDLDSTLTMTKGTLFKFDYNNQSTVFKSSRNQRISIGRSESADIFIDSEHVSRNHATLVINYDSLFLEDHSSNGTYIYLDEREIFQMDDSMELTNSGQISCGISMYSSSSLENDIITYQLLDDTH